MKHFCRQNAWLWRKLSRTNKFTKIARKKGQVEEKTHFCVLMKDTRFKHFNSMLRGVH